MATKAVSAIAPKNQTLNSPVKAIGVPMIVGEWLITLIPGG